MIDRIIDLKERDDRNGPGSRPGKAAKSPRWCASTHHLPALKSSRLLHADPSIIGSSEVANASLPAVGGKIVAVEPDGVAAVRWDWPREWDSQLLRFLAPTSLSASLSNNVAVASAPARFRGSYAIGPYAVTLAAPGGVLLDRYVDAGSSASN